MHKKKVSKNVYSLYFTCFVKESFLCSIMNLWYIFVFLILEGWKIIVRCISTGNKALCSDSENTYFF